MTQPNKEPEKPKDSRLSDAVSGQAWEENFIQLWRDGGEDYLTFERRDEIIEFIRAEKEKSYKEGALEGYGAGRKAGVKALENAPFAEGYNLRGQELRSEARASVIEEIREWAEKNKKNNTYEVSGTTDWGYIFALDDLLNKLNEMK